MGITRTDLFTPQQNALATLAKVLGHPARIAILQHLMKTHGCICGDLVEEIGLAQATISQHLRELKNIGIIKGEIDGTSVCYCIDGNRWSEIKNMLNSFFDLKSCTDKCC